MGEELREILVQQAEDDRGRILQGHLWRQRSAVLLLAQQSANEVLCAAIRIDYPARQHSIVAHTRKDDEAKQFATGPVVSSELPERGYQADHGVRRIPWRLPYHPLGAYRHPVPI